jgi:pimeloyl-ACP methyl ester carboxylesterase
VPASFRYHLVETASGRTAAFQTGGTGPAVVLLHESPRSSVAVMPLAERLAHRFTVFAIDTPGFGLSDPLPIARPSEADFAIALAETLDAIGLARTPIYGTHTGAVIAIAYGMRFPDRTASLVLDGYPVFAPGEQEEGLASYLVDFKPEWDGTHLAWLAGRVKDQFTFFPWYRRGQSARLPRPLVPETLMSQVVIDLMSAGRSYRDAYASAFRFQALPAAAAISVPTAFMARTDDLLFSHLDRLPGLAANCSIHRLGPDRELWACAIGDLFAAAAATAAPSISPPAMPGHPTTKAARRIVHTADGTAGLRVTGARGGRPLVLLPAIPGAAVGLDEAARRLGVERQAIAVDLPGGGVSSATDATTIAGIVAAIASALLALGVANYDVIAVGESARLGIELAALQADARLALIDPVPDTENARRELCSAMASIVPRVDGTQLLAAWHQLRDRELWMPWFMRDPAHALDCGTDPDPARLQAVLTEWLRGGTGTADLLALVLSEPLAERLRMISARATLIGLDGHPCGDAARALANGVGAGYVGRHKRAAWEAVL